MIEPETELEYWTLHTPTGDPGPLPKNRIEEFTPKVKHDALLYCAGGTIIEGYVGVFPDRPIANPRNRDPNFSWLCGRHMSDAALPPEVAQFWQMKVVSPPDPERDLAPYIATKRIAPDAAADVIPDIVVTHNFPLVRANAREVLLDLDPEAHFFLPARVETYHGGVAVPGEWYHWVIRRRLMVKPEHHRPNWSGIYEQVGSFSQRGPAHLFYEHVPTRDWVSGLTAVGMSTYFYSYGLTRTAFGALKAAGVTGLVERTTDHGAPVRTKSRKNNENVSHIG
ncbi:MAG: hypothetical protein AAF919_02490 [Pseudomonadota bacterium]